MTHWHPDDMTLMNYVAGSISEPEALAIATHLGFCHECRTHVKNLNHLGGALLDTIKPASIENNAFDALMATLELHHPTTSLSTTADEEDDINPMTSTNNPLEKYLPAPMEELQWHKQTKEISKFNLSELMNVKGFQVALQKIKAGARVPTHTHNGFEYTVILRGGFSDELGVYHAGDFIARDTTHIHSPTALQNEDCICLTVLSGPLKFVGWYRVLNPFMRWS
ncbi:MAG TPA: ChrR family anti-sigma-E factor [Cellvibrio sp.]|nr:ChrR family anti-sigma-E factor [Cellvibrio sp.]